MYTKGDPEKALDHYKRALRGDPDHARTRVQLKVCSGVDLGLFRGGFGFVPGWIWVCSGVDFGLFRGGFGFIPGWIWVYSGVDFGLFRGRFGFTPGWILVCSGASLLSHKPPFLFTLFS